jgi:hypothetical protein
MNAFARAAAMLVIAAIALGAAVLFIRPREDVGGPSPASSPSWPPLPSLDSTFASPTYGYQIRYPAAWTVTPASSKWPLGSNFGPGDPDTDHIVTPSGLDQMRISIASVALPSDMTIEEFRMYASPYSSPFDGNPCTPVASVTGPVMLAYRASPGASPQPLQAAVSINGCRALAELGGDVYDFEVLAGGRGYGITLDGHLSPADVQAWLASITLDPASAPSPTAVPKPSATK